MPDLEKSSMINDWYLAPYVTLHVGHIDIFNLFRNGKETNCIFTANIRETAPIFKKLELSFFVDTPHSYIISCMYCTNLVTDFFVCLSAPDLYLVQRLLSLPSP